MNAAASAAAVGTIVRAAETSFYWAMRLLPRAKREAMYALYAFCREVDNIADEPAPQSEKLLALDRWRRALDALYGGRAIHRPVAIALGDAIARFDLPREPFDAIVSGMETDARGPVVAPTADELELYCARVAGAVGLLSVRIFGCRDPRADDYALATGRALQLTNILRDIAEDAADGRLYLPREALEAAGVRSRDPKALLNDPRLSEACAAVAMTAEASYEKARSLRDAMAREDAACLAPAAIMTAIYRRLLLRIQARGWNRVSESVSLPRREKFSVIMRCLLAGG